MKNEIIAKVYVTKYALSTGISVFKDVEWCREISEGMIAGRIEGHLTQHFHGNEWHRTKEEALARAEEMRNAGIKSAMKKVDRLSDIIFKIEGED